MAVFRYSGNWRGYLEGSSSTVSQNIANNSSVIKVDVWIGMDAGWSIEFGNTYGNTVTVNCNGQSQTIAVGPLYLNGSKKHLGSVQFTVGHNADGTKTAGISLSSNMSNINYANLSFGNASGSWNHGLSTIPRSSSLSFGTGTIGSPLTITIGRASSSFTHTLRWAWGSRSGTIATGVGTSASWNIPMDFCNELPNNVSGTGTIFLDTYSGSTRVGTQSKQFTANVPGSVIPSFTGVTLDDQNATAKALITGNTFVQIMSNIKVTFNGAAGTYGSTIKGFRAEVLGRNLAVTSNGGTFGAMNFNGTAVIRASVTDSRGRTSATKDVTISLLEYFAPVISIQVLRTRENPNTLQVLRTIKVAPLSFGGVNKNSTKLAFEVAPLGSTSFVADNGAAGGEWTTIFTLTNSGANLAGTYTSTSSWTVRAKLSDKFTSSNPTIVSSDVGTESVIHGYDRDGRFGVGKTPELGPPGSVDAAGNIYAKGKIIQQHPLTQGDAASGIIRRVDIDQVGSTEFGWGQISRYFSRFSANGVLEAFYVSALEALQRWTSHDGGSQFGRYRISSNGSYSAWKAVGIDNFYPIGAIYESTSSDNPSTFMGGTWERFGNGKVLVGLSENESEFNAVNKSGGAKTHTLSVGELPSHSHGQVVTANDGGTALRRDYSSDGRGGIYAQGVNTESTGSNLPHNNLQPYVTVYRWRRIA